MKKYKLKHQNYSLGLFCLCILFTSIWVVIFSTPLYFAANFLVDLTGSIKESSEGLGEHSIFWFFWVPFCSLLFGFMLFGDYNDRYEVEGFQAGSYLKIISKRVHDGKCHFSFMKMEDHLSVFSEEKAFSGIAPESFSEHLDKNNFEPGRVVKFVGEGLGLELEDVKLFPIIADPQDFQIRVLF
jgi:hypothetical protein